MMKDRRILLYGALFSFFFLIDRITKYGVLSLCSHACRVSRYLSFEIFYNRGISWGLLHGNNNGAFVLMTIVIALLTLMFAWYAMTRFYDGRLIIGEVMILAGSISNIIDRIVYRGVLDFVDISYNGCHWPLFNGADVSIVFGVIVMIFVHYTYE